MNRGLTKQLRIKISCLLFTGMLGCIALHAQSSTAGSKQVYAVLVGISRYRIKSENLNFADADANDMYKALIKRSVPPDHITLLTNEQATKNMVLAAMKEQFLKAAPDDEVIFFFSGHGGHGYLVPTDMPLHLYYEDIKTVFRSSKASRKFIFTDACFSGGLKETPKNNNPVVENIPDPADGSRETVVFSGSRPGQESKENFVLHGFFTHFLLKALEGAADLDNNGMITYEELFTYVNNHVQQVSANRQVPTMFGKFKPGNNFFSVIK